MEIKTVKTIALCNEEILDAIILYVDEKLSVYRDDIVVTQTVDEGLKATITIELD